MQHFVKFDSIMRTRAVLKVNSKLSVSEKVHGNQLYRSLSTEVIIIK